MKQRIMKTVMLLTSLLVAVPTPAAANATNAANAANPTNPANAANAAKAMKAMKATPSWSFAGFPLAGRTSSPIDGLHFGMSFEDAWQAAPRLRDAFRMSMEDEAYGALWRRFPDVGLGSCGTSNRWRTMCDRPWHDVEVDGVRYQLRFNHGGRLRSIWMTFANEGARRAALVPWGKPTIAERQSFWLNATTGICAGLEDCDGARGCAVSLEASQPVERLFAQLFPDQGTLVGMTEAAALATFGEPIDWGNLIYQLIGQPGAAGPVRLEVDFGDDVKAGDTTPRRAIAYTIRLAWTYAASQKPELMAALQQVVPDLRLDESNPGSFFKRWRGLRGGVDVVVVEEPGVSAFTVDVGPWSGIPKATRTKTGTPSPERPWRAKTD